MSALPRMSTIPRLVTYDDLIALPDDGNRYEIIDGVLIVSPAPSLIHGNLITRLMGNFVPYLAARQLIDYFFTAPVDVHFSNLRVVEPDFVFVSPERRDLLANPAYINGAPDLVIEVLSPSNKANDLINKFRLYAEEGVREYWIVDPELKTVTIYALRNDRFEELPNEGGIARSVVLPGLEVDTAALFANLLRAT